MNTAVQKMREIAARILKDGTVEAVIGYTRTDMPGMTRPIRITTPDNAEKLVFNRDCRLNLANYIGGQRSDGVKNCVAIVSKGCDSRNIVIQMHENRVKRDQLFVIGMPCTGMADKNSPEQLQDNCRTCIQHNPVIFDEMAGEAVSDQEPTDRFSDVEKIEDMGVTEKQVYFDDLLANCIRCYACRDACPLCYCPTCFVDESRPQWIGKTNDPVDVKTYHLLRAFHDAGRCTDCGACEAACPMDIKVRQFTRKTIKDSVSFYGLEAGLSETIRPALDLFQLDDPEEFIR